MVVGEKYYFVVHAYYHFLGEVVEITGKRSCILKNVVRIHSCQRNFTLFFKDGCKSDTEYTVWPDGHEIPDYLTCTPWKHTIPKV